MAKSEILSRNIREKKKLIRARGATAHTERWDRKRNVCLIGKYVDSKSKDL